MIAGMEPTPSPAEAPLPRSVSRFAPWRWFRSWSWRQRGLFAVALLVVYVESAVVMLPLLHRLIARHPIRGTLPTALAHGVEFFYMPLGLLAVIPGVVPLLEAQANFVDTVLVAIGL